VTKVTSADTPRLFPGVGVCESAVNPGTVRVGWTRVNPASGALRARTPRVNLGPEGPGVTG
jgi:hypothetical protein